MRQGRVYIWIPDPNSLLGGRVMGTIVPLPRLETQGPGSGRLWGRYVRVRNGGWVNAPDLSTGTVRAMPLGDAQPNADGDFLFEPGRGGGRMDKVTLAEPDFRRRYIQAARFGEVNTYYHLDRMAAYIDDLLRELGAASLPRVTAVVHAHHAATERDGLRDGLRRGGRWLPFQGGHYRLPSHHYGLPEYEPVATDGEIHLGPGWQLLDHGALVEAAGSRYRANASHNAGIIYHEYGHHVTRHTADFRANALRSPDRQSNRKTALDEGFCDYLAATMLGTPHIWALHRRHDTEQLHPRSLVSPKTMADYCVGLESDVHANGTIWAAALWDLRTLLAAKAPDGARQTDLLVLKTLLLLGQLGGAGPEATVHVVRRARRGYAVALAALLQADERLNGGRHGETILTCFARRGVRPDPPICIAEPALPVQGLLRHVTANEIPASGDLLSADRLEAHLDDALGDAPLSLVAVGDIMQGGRARQRIIRYGADYPFRAILPLLRRGTFVLANLEAPFAREARQAPRNHSYRVNPRLAVALAEAGIRVVTLANNHLLDCGRAGVLETLDALTRAGVIPVGAGVNEQAAHAPAIREAGRWRVGLLGYYWNRRCAATEDMPGSAMDSPAALEADIRSLRKRVDWVIATFHWGVPYVREPSAEDLAKARFAIDCGADVVVGHHPHVVQPMEIYHDGLIFYSLGNCMLGSGNSRAEGLAAGLCFGEDRLRVHLFPLYVKNRDPRVDYQPKVLGGRSAERLLSRVAEMSGPSGTFLRIEQGRGRLDVERPAARRLSRRTLDA